MAASAGVLLVRPDQLHTQRTMMIAEKAADIILGNEPLPADHTPVFRRDIEPA